MLLGLGAPDGVAEAGALHLVLADRNQHMVSDKKTTVSLPGLTVV